MKNRNKYHTLRTGNTRQHNVLALVLIIAVGFFFVRCNTPENEVSGNAEYFDLASLVQKDIDYNTANACSEEKSVYMNGNKETKLMDSIDWKSELQPLMDCDINKPAWKGKYFVDTATTSVTNITTIHHKALSDKVTIKSLVVELKGNEIQRIFITKRINSFIFSSLQIIEYFPAKGFSVRGEQKAALMKTFDLNVDVVYKCKQEGQDL
jgi:hypothetical protein